MNCLACNVDSPARVCARCVAGSIVLAGIVIRPAALGLVGPDGRDASAGRESTED